MDRRRFIGGAAIAAAAAASACSPAQTNGESPAAPAVARRRTRELRMVTTWPPNFPGLGTAAERTAQLISQMSGGELRVRVYAAGEIVGAFEAFDAVSTGVADMYHAADYYWAGRSPAFNFYCSVPMGLNAVETNAWLDFGGGQELWEELAGQFNLITFAAGNTGHQMGGWFKREINSLDDFRGLRMRIPGLGGEVIRQLGGAAVALSGGEIYPALQSGAIDATEWVGPWNDLAFGFHREARYYYGPGFHEPGSALGLGINRGVWDGLPSEHQAIIRAACRAANDLSLGEFVHQNAIALRVLKEQHNVQLRDFSPEIWRRMIEVSEQVLADAARADSITRRVYDSYIIARRRGHEWGAISEAPYFQHRAMLFNG